MSSPPRLRSCTRTRRATAARRSIPISPAAFHPSIRSRHAARGRALSGVLADRSALVALHKSLEPGSELRRRFRDRVLDELLLHDHRYRRSRTTPTASRVSPMAGTCRTTRECRPIRASFTTRYSPTRRTPSPRKCGSCRRPVPDNMFDYVLGGFYEEQTREGAWTIAIPGSPEYQAAQGACRTASDRVGAGGCDVPPGRHPELQGQIGVR